jgi:aspartyl-tRNA(Asn)/glutamyl-tRNA(Gln) amidotransferase subunit A
MTVWWRQSATQLAVAYAAAEVSPTEVLQAVLDRLDKVNPVLNAVIAQERAGAIAAAAASTERWQAGNPLGPLDGVPFTIKDNIVTANLPTTWGSPLYRDYRAAVDELPVARMREAGAVLVGKTNLPELASQGYTDNALFGPTANPWNPALTPGGSSGGAVAAVAAGIGPIALGTDGGGSTRRPASHTGLVGLKPTPGRIPRCDGLPAILLDFEVIGPIARTVADVITLTQALSASDPRDPSSLTLPAFFPQTEVKRRRILFVPRFGTHPVDPEIATSVANAAQRLQSLGHEVEEGEAPFDVQEMTEIQATIGQAGLAWLMRGLSRAKPTAPALQALAASGGAMTAAALFEAVDATTRMRRLMAAFFETTDLILTPSAAALPWPMNESHPPTIDGKPVGPRGHAVFTAFANIAGLPSLALPSAPSKRGLPIGFQIVGPAGTDAGLLALGVSYEAAFAFADKWPREPKT